MTQLEEFRSHLSEADDAAARERARRRLRAAQAGPDPARRPHRPRRRLRLVVAGVTALAAALAAVLIGLGAGDEPTRLGPAPASAQAVLVRAAEAAADLRDGGIPRMVRPDEYFYLEIRGTYLDGIGASDGTMTMKLNTRTYRRWQSLTRPGRIMSDGPAPGAEPAGGTPAGRLMLYIGNERFSAEKLAAFDPTPQELYRRLLDGVSPGQGSSPESEVFVQLVDALRDVPLRPALRATFLRALAEVPGLVLTGPTKDALGRAGVGVAYIERSRADQRHALVLGEDGALLAVREETADGKLLANAVVVHQAITTDLKAPRDQVSAP